MYRFTLASSKEEMLDLVFRIVAHACKQLCDSEVRIERYNKSVAVDGNLLVGVEDKDYILSFRTLDDEVVISSEEAYGEKAVI